MREPPPALWSAGCCRIVLFLRSRRERIFGLPQCRGERRSPHVIYITVTAERINAGADHSAEFGGAKAQPALAAYDGKVVAYPWWLLRLMLFLEPAELSHKTIVL